MPKKIRAMKSLSPSTRASQKNKMIFASQKTVYILAQQAIKDKNYDQAEQIIDNDTPYRHWHKCLHAKILYQKNEISKAIQATKTSINFHRQNCCQCLQLLLTLMPKDKEKIKKQYSLLNRICQLQSVPNNLRKQFRSLLKQSLPDLNTFNHQLKSSCHQLLIQYSKRGVQMPKVEVTQIQEDYRVTVAKKIIQPQQVIIFVPENQIITLEKAKRNEIVKKISDHELSFRSPKHCILSAFLLLEKQLGKKSDYVKYINSLPRKLDNFPIYYSKDLEKELEGTSFGNMLRRKRLDLNEDYKQLIKIGDGEVVFTLEEFEWARMIVSSRIFGIVAEGIKTDALVPIADMLNHKLPKMTTWYFSDKKKGFVVQNMDKMINPEEQIYDSYGLKCNSRFLLNYGFIQENNTANEITISLKKIDESHTICQNIRISANLASQQFQMLMFHYRKQVYNRDDRAGIDNYDEKMFNKMISKTAQLSVWKEIGMLFSERMKKYPTSIRTDEKTLRNKNLDQNFRNCISIRLGEKRVIEYYVKMARVMQDYFSKLNKHLGLDSYSTYLNSIGDEDFQNLDH